LKAGDLIAAIFSGHAGFEKSGANGVQGVETLAVSEQHFVAFDFTPYTNHVVNALQLLIAQTLGHAQLSHIAAGAGHFDRMQVHVITLGWSERIDESHVILNPRRVGVQEIQRRIELNQVLDGFHLICIKMILDSSGKVSVR